LLIVHKVVKLRKVKLATSMSVSDWEIEVGIPVEWIINQEQRFKAWQAKFRPAPQLIVGQTQGF
jgi:hypothetical protein